MADKKVTTEKELRYKVEGEVLEYLRQKKFREASTAVAAFEAQQPFPRGMGIDWKHHNPNRDIKVLINIFSSKPKILSRIEEDKMEDLRVAAGMMFLWGTNRAKKWLPTDFKTSLYMDSDTAVRMFSFFASNKANLVNYRLNSDVVKGVKISSAPTSCVACKQISGMEFSLDDVLELPYEHCTHEKGCRCAFIPIVP